MHLITKRNVLFDCNMDCSNSNLVKFMMVFHKALLKSTIRNKLI